MNHSVTARYVSRPAAHFVRRAARARDLRLGLRPAGSFRAATVRPTVLRDAATSSVERLRAGRSTLRIVNPSRSVDGAPRPAVVMQWSNAGLPVSARQTSPAVSPWLG
jgi:hypothetical protein